MKVLFTNHTVLKNPQVKYVYVNNKIILTIISLLVIAWTLFEQKKFIIK